MAKWALNQIGVEHRKLGRSAPYNRQAFLQLLSGINHVDAH